MERIKLCAVVPAAGLGTRLGVKSPKLLASLVNGETIWMVLRRKLLTVVDHVNVIVSAEGETLMRDVLEREGLTAQVSLSLQPEPLGMGDAIFRGYPVWSRAAAILIVWGDQVFVSVETLSKACALHGGASHMAVLPVVSMPLPYVEYVFQADGRLSAVRQTREGDVCSPDGFGDVGTFVLSVADLFSSWTAYLAKASAGAVTGETNFLPFLPYLSSQDWTVKRLVITDPREARGINTPADLSYFRSVFAEERWLKSKG